MVHSTFAEAAEAFEHLVRQIPADAWDGPGLGEWDLRSLVGHTCRSLITVETYLGEPADVEEVTSAAAYYAAVATLSRSSAVTERGRQAGRAMGDDPVAYVHALVERVLPMAAAAGDPLIRTAAGGMRFGAYLPTRTFELVVHGFDIAAAAALPLPAYSTPVLTETGTLAAAAAAEVGQGRQVLLALTGRASLPAGFSVV